MGTGQTILTIGAIMILSQLVLNVYKGFLSSGDVLQESKLGVLATSVATSLVEEAIGKAFDEATVDDFVSSTDALAATLGPETGEVYPNFDDFDDYNDLDFTDTTWTIPYRVQADVVYVSATDPDGQVATRTWHKKLKVSVTSPFTPDTVRFDYVFSYWTFR